MRSALLAATIDLLNIFSMSSENPAIISAFWGTFFRISLPWNCVASAASIPMSAFSASSINALEAHSLFWNPVEIVRFLKLFRPSSFCALVNSLVSFISGLTFMMRL